MDRSDDDLPLERRARAAYAVLGLGAFGLALASLKVNGVTLPGSLVLGVLPYVLAAFASWCARHSWDATSWLYGTWVFLVGTTLLFQLLLTGLAPAGVLFPASGIIGAPWILLPAIAQFAVVGFAAAVAFVLHRRELRGL